MSEPLSARRIKRTWGTAPWWVLVLLGLVIVLLVALPFLLPATSPTGEEPYAGTDAQATQTLKDRGARPWFHSVFEPGSAEVESGLFALQAALGAGVVGYVGGRLHERRKQAAKARGAAPAVPEGPSDPREGAT